MDVFLSVFFTGLERPGRVYLSLRIAKTFGNNYADRPFWQKPTALNKFLMQNSAPKKVFFWLCFQTRHALQTSACFFDNPEPEERDGNDT
jgi:hypothetical protein